MRRPRREHRFRRLYDARPRGRAGQRRQGEHPLHAHFQDPLHDGRQRHRHRGLRGDHHPVPARMQGARRRLFHLLRHPHEQRGQGVPVRVRQPAGHPHPRLQVPRFRPRGDGRPRQNGVQDRARSAGGGHRRRHERRRHPRGHRHDDEPRLAAPGGHGISRREREAGDERAPSPACWRACATTSISARRATIPPSPP